MKICTKYLVSKPRSKLCFFPRGPPKEPGLRSRDDGSSDGCALAPRTRPLQQVNCTHSTLVEPLLVTLERLRLNPLRERNFFFAPYFFSCTKNNTNSLPSSCIDYRFARKLFVQSKNNLEPEESVGVNETVVYPWAMVYLVTGGNFQRTSVIQGYPSLPGASRTNPDKRTRLDSRHLK